MSTALHVTLTVELAANIEPEAGLQLDEALPMSSDTMTSKVAAIPLALVATRFWAPGQVISGSVVSETHKILGQSVASDLDKVCATAEQM